MISSQEIRSNLVSFLSTFEALQSELFRFKSRDLKILKILEFNLLIACLRPFNSRAVHFDSLILSLIFHAIDKWVSDKITDLHFSRDSFVYS